MTPLYYAPNGVKLGYKPQRGRVAAPAVTSYLHVADRTILDAGTFLFAPYDTPDRTHWLIGDVNCCILPDTHNPSSQRYLDVLYDAGYVCGINVPTRDTTNTSSCIGHIFVDSGNREPYKSDVSKVADTFNECWRRASQHSLP
ncbi:hypothetical protein J6590_040104 [Homalodisca vitripennis]|nr:hypothetical protein J6590_040104 [Homalodisca vitripennis]